MGTDHAQADPESPALSSTLGRPSISAMPSQERAILGLGAVSGVLRVCCWLCARSPPGSGMRDKCPPVLSAPERTLNENHVGPKVIAGPGSPRSPERRRGCVEQGGVELHPPLQ